MSYIQSFHQSIKAIDKAIHQGKSIIEIVQTETGITTQHLALLADELLTKLRHTTYELIRAKSLTGNTKPPIERSLSKALILFLHELHKNGGDCHYGTIRDIVQTNYKMVCNDYSTLKYYRLIEKSKTANGYWQITERGKHFLSGHLQLAEKVTIHNDKVISASRDLVSVSNFLDLKEYSVNDDLIKKRKDGLSRWHE